MFNTNKNFLEIGIILSLSLLILILWKTHIIYPIKLFIVLIHEINHAIATVLTGGSVRGISTSLDLGGNTIISGGNLIIISSAGYLGSLLWGVLFYLSSYNHKLRLWISTILAIIILLTTTNLISGGFHIFLSLVYFLVLILLPRLFSEIINSYFFKFFGITSCLYVITDIKEDLLSTSLAETDTQILEYLTDIPAELIGFTWLLISILVVFLLLKYSFNR